MKCKTCGKPIRKWEVTEWNGAEEEVLDSWWSHFHHPTDGHRAEPES